MFIKLLSGITIALLMSVSVYAQQEDHMAEHGGKLFHRFRLEAETGMREYDQNLTDWKLDGWYGSDKNRIRIDGSGVYVSGSSEHTELSVMYARNLSTFWDAQIGVRQDTRPESVSYLSFGIEGLAPYFFETDLHAFVSEDGDVSVQLRQENDVLLTQRLILKPLLQANLFLQDVPGLETGAGLTDAKIGLQLRYEYTRKIAPYASMAYERKFGKTASIAIANGIDRDTINMAVGLRFLF